MRHLNLVLSTAVLVPFLLLTGYYLFSSFRKTLEKRSELTTWEGHAFFAALLAAQILSIGIVGFVVYIVIYAKFFV